MPQIKKYPIADILKIDQRILSTGCLDAERLRAGTNMFQDFKNFFLTLYRPTHQIRHVSNLRVVRNDLEFPRKSENFSEFVILQIIFYLWLL